MTFVGPSTMYLTLPGIYRIDYTFLAKCAGTTLALFQNGVEIPGSRYTSQIAPDSVKGFVFFLVEDASTPIAITLRNVNPCQYAEVDCKCLLDNVVNASMLVTGIVVATV